MRNIDRDDKGFAKADEADEADKTVRVGVGVFVIHNGHFLMGLRQGAHGEGDWSLPGGHLEFGEDWETCAMREVEEETGLTIKNIQFLSITNDIFVKEGKHYVTVFMTSELAGGEVELREPDKCVRWDWFTFSNLPPNLFLPVQNLIAARKHVRE